MKNRKRKFRLSYVIAVLVIYAIVMIVFRTARDAIVITQGIRFYRSIRLTTAVLGGIICIAAAAAYFYGLVLQTKEQREYEKEQAQHRAEEEKKQHQAQQEKETLSVSRNMDSVKIRKILEEYSAGDWKYLTGELNQLHIQLDLMDEQQEKLFRLLQNNGAQGLENTVEILDKVEQHMCRSVRKVINYMDVAEPSRSEDLKKVQEKIYACHSDNQTQLQQVQEFLFALADFLNTQGDDDNSVQMLNLYKSAILDSIRD